MKKQLLTIIAIVLSLASFAQIKKKPQSKPSEIQQVKKDALSWFKNVYVESYFKDPYSYKLLKCDIYPTTLKEVIEGYIRDLDSEIYLADTSKFYSDYGKIAEKNQLLLKYNKRYPVSDTTTSEFKKRIEEMKLVKIKLQDELAKYNEILERSNNLKNRLKSLTVSESNKIWQYSVYIDCYSNNSYGNPVLGKYSLYFNNKGLVRDPIQLNKD